MSEDSTVEVLLEFLSAVEVGIARAKRRLAKTHVYGAERPWNPEKVKWETAEGSRGPYERSEDFNNLEFKAMLKDLAAHDGRLTCGGFFYWTFKNGSVVGRKRVSR